MSSPEHSLKYFDAWETGQAIETRQGTLHPDNLASWLNLSGRYALPDVACKDDPTSSVKLRVLCYILHRNARWEQLLLDGEPWRLLKRAFNIHEFTILVLGDNNGTSTQNSSFDTDDGKVLKQMQIVVKVPRCKNICHDSYSLSYNPSNGTVRAVLHAITPEDWNKLVVHLQSSLSIISHPMLVPVYLYESFVGNMRDYRNRVDDSVLQTERELGVSWPGRLEEIQLSESDLPERESRANDPSMSRTFVTRVHSFSWALATMGHVARFAMTHGNFLLETLDALEDVPHVVAMDRDAREKFRYLLVFRKNMAETLDSQIQGLWGRVTIMTNLIFSLISQEENRISRSVAEKSAEVAVAAKRDGSAMKTIALLTTLFLPATFVATLFSMPMLDWNVEASKSPHVSYYFWVYWVISIPLTIIVFLVWKLWWRMEEKRDGRNEVYYTDSDSSV